MPSSPAPNAGSAKGYGADIAIKGCTQSLDGLTACGANYTISVNSQVVDKGGAGVIEGDETSYIVMNRSAVYNLSAGHHVRGDPEGDGVGFLIATGTNLILESCNLTQDHCGKKVGFAF